MNGTYVVRDEGDTLLDFEMPSKYYFYQWLVPLLIFLSWLYRLPSLLWKFVIHLNGFDLSFVTKKVIKEMYKNEYKESSNWLKTQQAIDSINENLRSIFLKQKSYLNKKFNIRQKIYGENEKDREIDMAKMRKKFPNLKRKSTFPLLAPYLIIKLIYLSNILFNFWFLSIMLGFNYFTYGIVFLERMSSNNYKFLNEFFPKRVLCTTQIQSFQKENQATFVCSLSINLLNEIFFIVYWFWLVILSLLTISSILHWLLLVIRPYRRNLVLNCLQLNPKKNLNRSYTAAYYFSEDVTHDLADSFLIEKTGLSLIENFELFFNDVCSIDVIFVIKMIALNSNSMAMRDFLNNLWDHYLDLEDLKLRGVKHRPSLPVKRPLLSPQIEDYQRPSNMNSAEA